jgi:hypothetical protein
MRRKDFSQLVGRNGTLISLRSGNGFPLARKQQDLYMAIQGKYPWIELFHFRHPNC